MRIITTGVYFMMAGSTLFIHHDTPPFIRLDAERFHPAFHFIDLTYSHNNRIAGNQQALLVMLEMKTFNRCFALYLKRLMIEQKAYPFIPCRLSFFGGGTHDLLTTPVSHRDFCRTLANSRASTIHSAVATT